MSQSSRFAVAVHVLTLMAWKGEEPLKSEPVAESVNTNPVVIRRILCELAQAGLVVSQSGSSGGSRLSRPAEEVSLLDIYHAVESRGVFSLHRNPPSRNCPVGVNIETVLTNLLSEVNSAVDVVLAKITLADLVQRLKPCEKARSGRRSKIRAQESDLGSRRNGQRSRSLKIGAVSKFVTEFE